MSKHTKGKLVNYIGISLLVVLVLAFVVVLATKVAQKQLGKNEISAERCAKVISTSHTVIIQGDKATPSHIDAKQCDELTIINRDDKARLIAFGVHDAHKPYDGVSEKLLREDQSFTVSLRQSGQNFLVHDHNQEETQTTFTVAPL